MHKITKVIANVYDGTDSGRMLEGDRIFVAKSVVKELGMEDGAVEIEKYCLREIAGVGERILPADCFGNPILSKERG